MSKTDPIRLYTKDSIKLPDFDYIVIGAGSGGVATARRAASYGAKVALVSAGYLGGTCVNVGCVGKKITWGAAGLGEEMAHGESFGFDQLHNDPTAAQFNWGEFKTKRDAYIRRLHGIYYRNIVKDGIYLIRGKGEFDLDSNGQPDFSTLVILPVDKNGIDNSDRYMDDFDVDDYSGREVFVDQGFPIKFKINPNHPAPGSYQGSAITTTTNTQPLASNTNFISVAPGGYPVKIKFDGSEFCSTSDDFFAWTKQPRRICVTGAGYIGVELSQVMAALGSKVSFVIKGDGVLGGFDQSLTDALMSVLEKQCNMVKFSTITKVRQLTAEEIKAKGISGERAMTDDEVSQLFRPMHSVTDTNPIPDQVYAVYIEPNDKPQELLGYFDRVLFAIGRTPATHVMNIPTTMTNEFGYLKVDQMGGIIDDRAKNIFSIGDALGKSNLTPVAINFGRRLADFLFGGQKKPLVWHDKSKDIGVAIPSVVFSHPPMGSCGLTTQEAEKVYGKDKIRVWNAKFVPMYCALFKQEEKFHAVTKMITTREFSKYTQQEEDVVIGIHLLFPGADEAMQGFAIAVANRLPKSFVDNTIAIHPSAAEEMVLFR